jgi:hypothetical protein
VHGLAPSVLAPDNDFGTLRANFLCMILIRRDRKNLASAIGLSDVALRDRKCTRKDKAADRERMSMLSICWRGGNDFASISVYPSSLRRASNSCLFMELSSRSRQVHHSARGWYCEGSSDQRPRVVGAWHWS